MMVTNTRKYPDSIKTDRGFMRLSSLDNSSTVRIAGRKVSVADIPMSNFTLKCGHRGRGIALSVGDVVFCDECATDSRVVRAVS